MLRGATGAVGTHLSAGYDSAAVTATAARLLAPAGGKVVAFTAVPREGYDGPAPKDRIGDEGPLAAATAAMYPNIDHVLIRSGHLSPLDQLDRSFFLFDRPMLNPCNWVWLAAINGAARDRKLPVVLTGQMGNMSLSYNGLEFLPELLGRGRVLRLLREGAKARRARQYALARSSSGEAWAPICRHGSGGALPRPEEGGGASSTTRPYVRIASTRSIWTGSRKSTPSIFPISPAKAASRSACGC